MRSFACVSVSQLHSTYLNPPISPYTHTHRHTHTLTDTYTDTHMDTHTHILLHASLTRDKLSQIFMDHDILMSSVSVFSSFTKPKVASDTKFPCYSASAIEEKRGKELRQVSLQFWWRGISDLLRQGGRLPRKFYDSNISFIRLVC